LSLSDLQYLRRLDQLASIRAGDVTDVATQLSNDTTDAAVQMTSDSSHHDLEAAWKDEKTHLLESIDELKCLHLQVLISDCYCRF
jgi:hypothetical protein